MRKGILIFALLLITVSYVIATTWHETDVKCPVCGKTNKFQRITSYGSYIYSWPERLQYIYWPVTDNPSLYSCDKCKYSLFMWDFEDIGGDTLEMLKKELPKLNLTVTGYTDKMTNKLEAAEKIYKLFNHDGEFWCKFYRIQGYHYDNENKDKAKAARLKALAIADSMMQLPALQFNKKEFLFITASMKHFTDNNSAAIIDINNALTMKLIDPALDSVKNDNFNAYLDKLLNDLKKKINKEE